MQKLRLGAAVASAVLVVAAAVASANPSRSTSDRSTADDRKGIVIRVVAREAAATELDLGPTGTSQGDQIVFAEDLFDGATQVGEEDAICTLTRLTADGSTSYQCWGTHVLPDGQLTTRGLITYAAGESIKAEPYALAITGGTGRYRTAHGQVTITEVTPQEFRITYRILL